MREPARRIGGETRVFGEDVRRTYELRQLDKPAPIAKPDMEGIRGLRLPELLPGEEAFTERRHAETDKGVPKRRTAMTAANGS